jgi:gluconate 2-dehydrogenase gamma chain
VSDALGSRADGVLAAALDRLIPSDEHGPGALEAGVLQYIEGALGRAGDPVRREWRDELEALDDLARRREGDAFASLAPDAQDRVLGLVADAPFFGQLRQRAIEGMFGDPAWGGNIGGVGWRLLGYTGPRLAWSVENQQITEIAPAP